jgi:uncharacterized protein YjiS (DUF1127 family)
MSSIVSDGGVAVRASAGRFGWRDWLMGRLSWLEQARQALRRRAELKALLALDDRTLADIGVRRSEVQGVLYGVLSWKELAAEREARRLTPANLARFERTQLPGTTSDLSKAA